MSSRSTRPSRPGIVLTGTEIKSIRAGKVNLADAYARIERDEAWLVGAHIAPFEQANRYNHEPKRVRKLLLHRSEIDELLGRTKAKGQTIVPLRLYLNAQGPGEARAGPRPRQASSTTGAGTSPTATRGATSPGSSPTPSGRTMTALSLTGRRAAAPARALTIRAVDLHACGEPGRVIVGGVEDVPGATMFEAMTWLPGQPRRPPAADAPRAARLPGRELQPRPAVVEPRGGGRLRDHGAGRVPGDERHEHDVRRDRAARDRDAADDRAGHGADARGAGRADPRPGGLRATARSPA